MDVPKADEGRDKRGVSDRRMTAASNIRTVESEPRVTPSPVTPTPLPMGEGLRIECLKEAEGASGTPSAHPHCGCVPQPIASGEPSGWANQRMAFRPFGQSVPRVRVCNTPESVVRSAL